MSRLSYLDLVSLFNRIERLSAIDGSQERPLGLGQPNRTAVIRRWLAEDGLPPPFGYP